MENLLVIIFISEIWRVQLIHFYQYRSEGLEVMEKGYPLLSCGVNIFKGGGWRRRTFGKIPPSYFKSQKAYLYTHVRIYVSLFPLLFNISHHHFHLIMADTRGQQ